MLGIFGPPSSNIVMRKSRNSHLVNTFILKKCTCLTPLQLIIAVGPFTKWGIYFMHCNPTLVRGHGYIIIAIDYFTKWVEEIPTYVEDGKSSTLFLFNHVIR